MSQTSVRKATLNDLKSVQDLNHDLFLSDSKHLNDLNTNWPYEAEGENYFRKRVSGEGGVCFVAEIEDLVVGYVAGGWSHMNFSAYKGKRGELENILVKDEHHGSGVGAHLVAALTDWFKKQGAAYIMVDAYTKNENAIAFYQHEGFEPYSVVLWKSVE